jgi:hypothetical protein
MLPKQHLRRPGVRVARRIPFVLAWISPGASHGVSKDCPSIGLGARRPLLLGSTSALASVPPRFGPLSPGSRSCSAFVVSHHLDGFLRRASCGFVAPRSRSWGSPRCGLAGSGAEAPSRLRPSATLHPSKSLHARSGPPCLHGSPGRLPSCRSPVLLSLSSEAGSTPGFFSTGRVHGFSIGLSASGPVQLPWVSSPLALRISALLSPAPEGDGRSWDSHLTDSVGQTAPHQALGVSSSPSASRRRDSRVLLHRGSTLLGSLLVLDLAGTAPGRVRTSLELAGGGSCRSVLDSPWGAAVDGGDGDEEGRGFSGQGTRQVVPLRVPRDRVLVDHHWTSAGLGVDRHPVSPTGRSVGPRAPFDGFKPRRTRGPSQPEVGILSILVTLRVQTPEERDGDHPRSARSRLASPASPGSCSEGGSW